MRWSETFFFFPSTGTFALAFQNVGRERVIGQCDYGYEKYFCKPKKKCEVRESGIYYIHYTTKRGQSTCHGDLRFQMLSCAFHCAWALKNVHCAFSAYSRTSFKVFFGSFWDRILPYSPGWHPTLDPLTLPSWVLELQVFITVPDLAHTF
jgi:hypothetical protein